MRKHIVTLATIIAFGVSVLSSGAARVAAAPGSEAPQMQGTWSCETTKPNGDKVEEEDTIEYIGLSSGKWLHGIARPIGAADQPYYDYYLAHVHSQWVYIQINPGKGTYFVGTSSAPKLNGSHWNVEYPTGGGDYTFTESPQQFTISYANLTQVCNRKDPNGVPPRPTPSLKCTVFRTGQNDPIYEYLSVTKSANNSWQGVAMDSPSGGHVIYEYNIFAIPPQWVSVEINVTTGSYAIAMSHASPDLNNTIWVVDYPTVESGFTFRDVAYDKDALPKNFTLVFKDGYETCAPM
jgi:hypothetical protein